MLESAAPDPPDRPLPTERTVAGLIAEGLSNQQVAERLFVTRATVNTRLTHIFAKLGIASRAQLATQATRTHA